MKTAEQFAEELVNKVCSKEGKVYEKSLQGMFIALSDGGRRIVKKDCPMYCDEDFMEMINFDEKNEEVAKYLRDTADCITGLIFDEMDKNPSPSYKECMRMIIYFGWFNINFQGRWKICNELYQCFLISNDEDTDEYALKIAEMIDADINK